MSHLERLQQAAIAVATVSAVLGFASSGGCHVLPAAAPSLVGPLHALLLALGIGAGWLTFSRAQQVERHRWRTVQDPLATQGEKEYAHKEAESQRRFAGTAYLLAPMGLAFWLANHFDLRGQFTLSDLFLVTPLVGFLVGFLVAYRLKPSETPPPQS